MRALLVVGFCLASLIASAQGKEKMEVVRLNLGWTHQFQFAGYYAAKEKGFFAEEGLDVEISQSKGPGLLDSDYLSQYDYIVGSGSQIVSAPDPMNFVVVATIFQNSAFSLVVLSDSVRFIKDLEGGTIATGLENQVMLRAAGVDMKSIELLPPSINLQSLSTTKIDGVTQYTIDMVGDHFDNNFFKVFRPIDYGINFYGDCLLTTQNELLNNPSRVEKMHQAVIKGWEYAINNKEEMVDIISEKYLTKRTREELLEEADVIINTLILPEFFQIGHNDMFKWKNMEQIIEDFNLIDIEVEWESIIYDNVEFQRQQQLEKIRDLIIIGTVVIAIVILILLANSWQLKRAVDRRTDDLEKANTDIQNKNNQLSAQKQELESLNKFKDKMLAIISHDTKSPINDIESLLSLFEKTNITEEELKEFMGIARIRVRELHSLLENIVQWSKTQLHGISVNKESFELRPVVEESVKFFNSGIQKKQIDIEINVPDKLNIEADFQMISIVLRNLISNAIKFSLKTGKIIIGATASDDQIHISVQDFGLGIGEEQLSMIFTSGIKSTRGSHQEIGTGLGLILCRELIQAHQGTISVESKEKSGAIFTINLPQ